MNIVDVRMVPHRFQGRLLIGAVAALVTAMSGGVEPSSAADLPVPCIAGSCGSSGPLTWVTSGRATSTSTSNVLRIDQQTERAILNWSSFNVGEGGQVVFNQPSSSSIALNRIYQGSPSRIFGVVQANGQVYLVNPNGMIFGRGSRVNAAGLVVSTLDISDSTFEKGLLSPDLLQRGLPALQSDGRVSVIGSDGKPVLGPDGKPLEVQLVVEEGAQISSTAKGGRVLLASRTIQNAGSVSSPDGQVILAAGEKVYLQASNDPTLRGLLVEVDAGGKAWNQLSGNISAARGNVTMVGLAVNQDGRVSATTSIAANGSVRLLARDSTTVTTTSAGAKFQATHAGTVELGAGSVTSVTADPDDHSTAVDDQAQPRSQIEIMGHQVYLRQGARIDAPSGLLSVTAVSNPSSPVESGSQDPDAKVRIEQGVDINLAGLSATVPMSRNLVAVELRANELRDSPVQRDGPLRGQTVVVDARVGTPLADVSGALAAVPRGLDERLSTGGEARISSEGDIAIADGARIDVSGGVVNYEGGVIQTSAVITADGRIIPIGSADPNVRYVGVLNPQIRVKHDKWGVIEVVAVPGLNGRYEAGYVEGVSAGTVQFVAPAMLLNGTLVGQAVSGPYQRDPSTVPSGGTLVIGRPVTDASVLIRDYRAPSVSFSELRPTTVVGDSASLPASQTLELPVDYLTDGGFTRTQVYSNGSVTLPEGLPLQLLPGSSLALAANRIDIGSDIASMGGTLSFLAGLTVGVEGDVADRAGTYVGDGVSLDVSGGWTNDSQLAAGGASFAPVYRNGGNISFVLATTDTPADLSIGDDARLAVNAGAWLDVNGRLRTGQAGGLLIRARGTASSLDMGTGVRIEGYGVEGSQGGSLELETARIDIVGAGSDWVDPGRISFDAASDTRATLHSNLFSDYGFTRFNLIANGPVAEPGASAATVAPGVTVQLVAMSRQIETADLAHPTGDLLADFAPAVLREQRLRAPTTFALRATPREVGSEHVGGLTVAEGASILADPGSTLLFESVGGLAFDGVAQAAGGNITLHQATPDPSGDAGFDPDLAIELGSGSVLDVSGTLVLQSGDEVYRQGRVLAGGTIQLLADRGSVIANQGSTLDVSGTQGSLDLPTGNQASPFSRRLVASAGGAITIRAPESVQLAGTIRAGAGVGETGRAPGGSLNIALTRQLGFSPGSFTGTFPTTGRVIRVAENTPGVAPPVESGVSYVGADLLESSGIDALRLSADTRIELDAGLDLKLERSLVLDSQALAMLGSGSTTVSAAFVQIGNSAARDSTQAAIAGDSVLHVQGDFVELLGSMVTQGISRVDLQSAGDIRLRGTERGATASGAFTVAGDLDLTAGRVYAGTASNFTLRAAGGDHDAIRLLQQGVSAGVPLSVGSRITLTARTIEQSGSLYAPFGAITLNGTDSVTLADGSITSVSANGALLPYGRVQNGQSWTYSLTSAFRTEQPAIPDRRLTINGNNVVIAHDAVADISGGGDLYAYEWVPGTGGSRDALAAGATPGLYAVLPSLRGQYAPYDPQEFAGSGITPGASIYLSGDANGLAAGVYPLLPARYALLPGAFLVSAVGNTTDALAGVTNNLPDGTPVVAGSFTFGATGLGETRLQGFAVRPGSYGRTLAQYDDYRASTFYPTYAANRDLPAPAVPADSGTLAIVVGSTLDALGRVLAAPATHGQGATIAIAAPRIEVVQDAGPSEAGTVQLTADLLQAWDPGRLVLGAELGVSGDDLKVAAGSIEFGSGVDLAFDEIVAVATGSIELRDGSSVASTSGANPAQAPNAPLLDRRVINLTGTGASRAALLAVSDRALLIPTRTGTADPAGAARIGIDSGATLSSRGALTIDAPGSVAIEGQVEGDNAAWSLGSSRIQLGGDDASGAGLVIGGQLLSAAERASVLRLATPGTVDFLTATDIGDSSGNLSGSLRLLEIDAAGLRNLSTIGGVSTLAAREVRLIGVDGEASVPTGATSGSLDVRADDVQIGAGNLAIGGFAQVSVDAATQIQGVGIAAVTTDGSLTLASRRLTARPGSDVSLRSTRDVTISNSTRAGTSPLPAAAAGGALSIAGQSIAVDGAVVLPSGNLRLASDSSLSLGSHALLDVSGAILTVRGQSVAADGGTISLAAAGNLDAAQGSRISVAGRLDSSAGRLVADAGGQLTIASTLDGRSSGGYGATFEASAGQIVDFGGLNQRLQAAGFDERLSFRTTTGDLQVGAGETVKARQVELVAAGGALTIDGSVIAATTSLGRGLIRLYSDDALTVSSTGVVRADASSQLARGGTIELGSGQGNVGVLSGATLSASGPGGDGDLIVRAAATTNDIAISELAADLTAFERVSLEAVLGFDVSAAPDAAELQAVNDATAAYVAGATSQVFQRLGLSQGPNVALQPGIELRRDGDLQLDSIALDSWRFNGQPASLTARASGTVAVTGTISDGYVSAFDNRTGRSYLNLLSGPTSTIRITAGADLDSPDPMAVAATSESDLVLAAGAIVRTGSGGIQLAAGRDIVFDPANLDFGLAPAIVLNAGSPLAPSQVPLFGPVSTFAGHAAAVRLVAGRDVVGAPVAQSVTMWQPRVALSNASVPQVRWGFDPAAFGWNVGSVGGEIDVRAGGDVSSLSAAAADVSLQAVDGRISASGGGQLQVRAAGDIGSGMFYAATGTTRLVAGGGFTQTRTSLFGESLGTLLMLGDASAQVSARQDASLESILAPSILTVPDLSDQVFYFRYSEDTSVRVRSSGGSVSLRVTPDAVADFIGYDYASSLNSNSLAIMPPSLDLASLSGDIVISGTPILYPSDAGRFHMVALRDVRADGQSASILMSDGSQAGMATQDRPTLDGGAVIDEIRRGAASARHVADSDPVMIAAGRDVRGLYLQVPKAATLLAGHDIHNVALIGQNLRAGDVTSIDAIRDVSYGSDSTNTEITLGGPGRLDIVAGRDIDLGFSAGVSTIGRLANGAIESETGASVSMIAGLGTGLDTKRFLDDVIAPSTDYQAQLIAFVERQTGVSDLTFEQARALLESEDPINQRPLLTSVFFSELLLSGREANKDPAIGFSRGYDAIDALFPNSRPGANQTSPYVGDLTLPFSRIYTLAGGDISLLVPGGLLNVGLASPPSNLGVSRKPAQLGIVTQKAGDIRIFTNDDVLVNQSRVFTLLGGSILVWSTRGNIDAGRGAKTAISAPPPTVVVDASGRVSVDFSGAVAGSGIRTILTDDTIKPGDVDLIAPAGFVNAGDAGIGASGNLNVAAQTVVGLDNIQVGGVSTGVPAETSGLGASLSGASSVGSGASQASDSALSDAGSDTGGQSLADTALSWLDVFVVGLGEEQCDQKDLECLKRQRKQP